ncbi:unnamed protein product, partial [Amoebophrya sp. A25]
VEEAPENNNASDDKSTPPAKPMPRPRGKRRRHGYDGDSSSESGDSESEDVVEVDSPANEDEEQEDNLISETKAPLPAAPQGEEQPELVANEDVDQKLEKYLEDTINQSDKEDAEEEREVNQTSVDNDEV